MALIRSSNAPQCLHVGESDKNSTTSHWLEGGFFTGGALGKPDKSSRACCAVGWDVGPVGVGIAEKTLRRFSSQVQNLL